jgi:hypothetical protein
MHQTPSKNKETILGKLLGLIKHLYFVAARVVWALEQQHEVDVLAKFYNGSHAELGVCRIASFVNATCLTWGLNDDPHPTDLDRGGGPRSAGTKLQTLYQSHITTRPPLGA